MAKENQNRIYRNTNACETVIGISQNWQFKSIMNTEHIKVWDVVLETNREYAPNAIFSFPKKQIKTFSVGYVRLKRTMDILGAINGLILTFPVSILLAISIKLTSKGGVFYSQERVGKQGRIFQIYKFRSMVENAEPNGPKLATSFDSRITRIGRFMRRFKLDEIPNFANVLKGDMALVGYRPERPYYIEQIKSFTMEYHQLLQIKPGITSIGQTRFGYASTVEQMVQRLKFDLEYLKTMSISTDIAILFRTILCIVNGNDRKSS